MSGESPRLMIREASAGAFERSARLREIAEQMRATMEVRVSSADDVMNADRPYRVLLPGSLDVDRHALEVRELARRELRPGSPQQRPPSSS